MLSDALRKLADELDGLDGELIDSAMIVTENGDFHLIGEDNVHPLQWAGAMQVVAQDIAFGDDEVYVEGEDPLEARNGYSMH